MASRNYLVNIEDLTLAERRTYKLKALAAGLERCQVKGIGDLYADIPTVANIPDSQKRLRVENIANFIKDGTWPRSIDQRELVTGPARSDFVAATAADEMLTAPLAVVGNAYSCFQAIAAPQMLINRLVVFYGLSVQTAPSPISYLLFRTGGAVGNVTAMFDTQTQRTRLNFDAFFSEPVVVDPQEIFAAQVIASAIFGACQLHLHNFVFGPAGQLIL